MIDYQTQRRAVEEYHKHGTYKLAARIIGIHPSTCARICRNYDRYGESLFTNRPVELNK